MPSWSEESRAAFPEHRRCPALDTVPLADDDDGVARLMTAQRVRHVVQIRDLLIADCRDHVTPCKPRLLGGTAGADRASTLQYDTAAGSVWLWPDKGLAELR